MYVNSNQPRDLTRKQSPVKENYRPYDRMESFKTAAESVPFVEADTANHANPVMHLGRSMCAKAFASNVYTRPLVTLQQ